MAQQLINSNGISQIALAFFTALLGMVSSLAWIIYKDRQETRDTRKAVEKATQSAKTAAENTASVANGFTDEVLERLSELTKKIDRVSGSVGKHMEWHLDQVKQDKGGK